MRGVALRMDMTFLQWVSVGAPGFCRDENRPSIRMRTIRIFGRNQTAPIRPPPCSGGFEQNQAGGSTVSGSVKPRDRNDESHRAARAAREGPRGHQAEGIAGKCESTLG